MRKNSRANKGQFFVIAALLVSVVLVGGVISTYSLVRYSSVQQSVDVLGAVGEMNTDIQHILDFTVGYYGSILTVTGNSTYAEGLTTNYLSSGLLNIARSNPAWNPSFTLDFAEVKTRWFMPESYSIGNISVTYSLSALGIEGIKYETYSALTVNVLDSEAGKARINVTRDNSEPELGLTINNFMFYNYSYTDSTWELVYPTSILISSDGVYTLTLPNGVDSSSYSVQVEDNRGLVVSAFYSPDSLHSDSGIPRYTYTFDWESTGLLNIYNSLSTDNFVIEVLQNGTLRWLGEPIEITPSAKPIPPVAVKSLRVNATISGVNQEIPFQVEDWASEYMVPLGLSGNDSLVTRTNMLVFMVNNEVSDVTLWWDGNDTTTPTPYAWENLYFNDDVSNAANVHLDNGNIDLYVTLTGSKLSATAYDGFTSSKAEFLRINGATPVFGAGTSCVIYNGVVRDVLQQEPEYGGGAAGAPNFYSQLIITLPANTNYYTYVTRMVFVESVPDRTVNDLSVVQLSDLSGTPLTENGTLSGYPVPDSSQGTFYDQTASSQEHHWSEFISGSSGAGVMFRDMDSQLYTFDDLFSCDTGAVVVDSVGYSIEVNPVDLTSIDFKNSLDVAWYGAVVTFDGESIHPTSGQNGLWVMVESPPTVIMGEAVESEFDFVEILSNVDSSLDKGTHSAFAAQRAGPDSNSDTLTEVLTGNENFQDYVDNNTGDVDTSADVGSHSEFSALQSGPDSIMDVLQELNAVGGSDEWVYPTGHQDSTNSWWDDNLAYDGSFGTSALIWVPGNSWSNYLVLTHDSLNCDTIRYYASGHTGITQIEIDVYNGSWVNVYSGSVTKWAYTNVTFSETSVTQIRVRFYNTQNNARYARLHEVHFLQRGSTNFNLDLEVQWTGVTYNLPNEHLAIYGGTMGAEDIAVDVWTGSSWQNVFSDLSSGWNNVSISSWLTDSTFSIRFRGGAEVSDSTQDSWQIDAALLHLWNGVISYEIDLEVQWINADYDETNEELCIYVGEVGSENLMVDVWTGSGWDNLFSSLNIGWNNATVSSYLTGSSFTIRFVGATETGDSIQNYWTIDATLLHTWS